MKVRSPGMIVKLDSNDFVISVEHEEVEKVIVPPATQVCKGPWHYKGGKGTVLPLESFPMNQYRPNTRTKTCGECLERSGKRKAGLAPSEADRQRVEKYKADREFARTEKTSMNKIIEQRVPILSKEDVDNGMVAATHKWVVRFLNPTEAIVYADTYVDAAQQVQGDIISIARLD